MYDRPTLPPLRPTSLARTTPLGHHAKRLTTSFLMLACSRAGLGGSGRVCIALSSLPTQPERELLPSGSPRDPLGLPSGSPRASLGARDPRARPARPFLTHAPSRRTRADGSGREDAAQLKADGRLLNKYKGEGAVGTGKGEKTRQVSLTLHTQARHPPAGCKCLPTWPRRTRPLAAGHLRLAEGGVATREAHHAPRRRG